MLRVGLTGGLGSGKSTVAQMFGALGAHVISADELGRRLMQPGEEVYRQIVEHFGSDVVRDDGTLNRPLLADLAFRHGRLDELNRIVHPVVIAAQEKWADELAEQEPDAIAMIESALIFEASASGSVPGWRDRFDKVVLVTAPDELKVRRFLDRVSVGKQMSTEQIKVLEDDARSRLAAQIPDSEKIPLCDYVIDNSGSLEQTERQVGEVVAELRQSLTR
jgi:dephospho-CoA kinase